MSPRWISAVGACLLGAITQGEALAFQCDDPPVYCAPPVFPADRLGVPANMSSVLFRPYLNLAHLGEAVVEGVTLQVDGVDVSFTAEPDIEQDWWLLRPEQPFAAGQAWTMNYEPTGWDE